MTVYVTEFASLTRVQNFNGTPGAPTLHPPALTSQSLAATAGNTVSAALDPATKYVRINTDSAVLVDIGESPVAANGWRMSANQTEVFGIAPTMRVAVSTTI